MDWSAVAAAVAAVIALMALSVSISEGRAARRHYRLSVQPRLRIDRIGGTKMVLENTGPGTAVITRFRVRANGTSFESDDDSQKIVRAMAAELQKALPNAKRLECSAYIPDPDGDSLTPQGKKELLIVKNPPRRDKGKWKVHEQMGHVHFDIRYASVYGEEKTLGNFDIGGEPGA